MCFGLSCCRQQKRHAAAPPPAGVWRRMERNRQKLVGRDKGSLTEQQTKEGTQEQKKKIIVAVGEREGAGEGPGCTRGVQRYRSGENTTKTRTTDPLSQTGPAPRAPERWVSSLRPPHGMAHGMEYPALFGQVGVGSAHPAVPLPGLWWKLTLSGPNPGQSQTIRTFNHFPLYCFDFINLIYKNSKSTWNYFRYMKTF